MCESAAEVCSPENVESTYREAGEKERGNRLRQTANKRRKTVEKSAHGISVDLADFLRLALSLGGSGLAVRLDGFPTMEWSRPGGAIAA
jgi:hypothetical protein